MKPPRVVKVDLELELDVELIERRWRVRPIACPIAEEHTDEETWSDWVTLSGFTPLTPS
jgi:hypothetical protein